MRIYMPPETEMVEPDPTLCPHCHGRGWRVEPDDGAGRAVRCDCVKRDSGPEYLRQAGIPERYQHCRLWDPERTGAREEGEFNTSPDEAPEAVRQRLARANSTSWNYVEKFFDPVMNRFRSKGLLYIGDSGSGKTHLAVAVLRKLIERYRCRGRFVDFTELISKIQSSFDPTSTHSKHALLDPVIEAEVLVVDELGAQKPADWVDDILYLIINTRYLKQRPTLFTTNYPLERKRQTRGDSPAPVPGVITPDAHAAWKAPLNRGGLAKAGRQEGDGLTLKKLIASTVVSRLHEMTEPVYLPSWDYRHRVMSKRDRIGR